MIRCALGFFSIPCQLDVDFPEARMEATIDCHQTDVTQLR
jgi:hypothetical protein